MRTKKLILNSIAGISNALATILAGFILPRLILVAYGSEYNGLVASIMQFVTVAQLFQGGVSSLAQYALFEPLSKKDYYRVSVIQKTVSKFINKVFVIAILYLLVVSVVYPFVVIGEFDWTYSFSFVLILGFGMCIQYFLGLSSLIVLNADQKSNVIYFTQAILTLIGSVLAAILILNGYDLRLAKGVAALVLVIQVPFLRLCVRKLYNLEKRVPIDIEILKQKWSALGKSLSEFVSKSSGIIIITLFMGATSVSIFSVHVLVPNGLYALILPITSAIIITVGNVVNTENKETILQKIKSVEQIIFIIYTVLFGTAVSMITPFISLYTSGIKDANYYQPIFAIIIVIAYLFTCLQRITMIMTFTKGHFKKTMPIDITSTVLTVSLSVGLTIPLGIIGAAIGLLCGEVYRAFAYANYSSNNLLQRDKFYFVKRVLFLLMGIFLVFAFSYVLPKAITWSIWILDCFLCAVVSTVLALIIEFIFYKRDLNHSVQIITQMFLKK